MYGSLVLVGLFVAGAVLGDRTLMFLAVFSSGAAYVCQFSQAQDDGSGHTRGSGWAALAAVSLLLSVLAGVGGLIRLALL